ncbi:hypothetical protein [Patiriisocius sp. Uisw_017]|jgi:hypothetical protein|uniref:hypothetical protein n=1 Tax=Patiriisocius sp. Uisw_017 TaxID=3230968 RepID=UPI0039EB5D4D
MITTATIGVLSFVVNWKLPIKTVAAGSFLVIFNFPDSCPATLVPKVSLIKTHYIKSLNG